MLTLLHWVRDGQMPLAGPQASFATGHHGVAYYWMLAPSAFLSDVDPAVVVTTVALIGIAGVAATWWLGRTVGGPLAVHVAALLMAVSPSAIGASTFLWNANIVGPVAALAAACSAGGAAVDRPVRCRCASPAATTPSVGARRIGCGGADRRRTDAGRQLSGSAEGSVLLVASSDCVRRHRNSGQPDVVGSTGPGAMRRRRSRRGVRGFSDHGDAVVRPLGKGLAARGPGN